MKLKITDVREVIGELITETWSPHDVNRPWKYGTPEERARIEREMGMKLNWASMMGSIKYDDFQDKWRKPGRYAGQSLLYYVTGISVKDVHSTLDEGYAICIVATSYDSPFGRPTGYWVAGYGPKPDMDELSKMIITQQNNIQNRRDIAGSDRLYEWLKREFFNNRVSKIIYTEIVEFAHRMKMDIRVNVKPNYNFVVEFADEEHMQYAIRQTQNEIKIALHKEFPDIKAQVHVNFTVTDGVEYSIFIYNKWTNYRLGIIPVANVNVRSVKDNKFTI